MTAWVKWTLAVLVFTAVVTVATMYSATRFDEAKSARIAAENPDRITVDSIYSDRIEGQYDPEYDRSRYQAIAKSFESDPLYIDEYQVLQVQDADLEAIRTEISDLEVPIYVAVLTLSDLDAGDGNGAVTAARIAAELTDEKATVLVVNQNGEEIGDKGVIRDIDELPEFDPEAEVSTVALDYVQALKSAEVEDPDDSFSRTLDSHGDPIVVAEDTSRDPRELVYPGGGAAGGIALGIIVGAGLGVVGVFSWRSIRKRNKAT